MIAISDPVSIESLNLRPDAGRIAQILGALDNPHSNYAGLPESERTRLKGGVLLYARDHRVRLPKQPGIRPPQYRKSTPAQPEELPPLPQDVRDLFADLGRWPRKPYCSDDLEVGGTRIRSLASALKKPYIQANPPHLRVWSIHDIDRPGAATAWEDAKLPPPSWASVNLENGHAHLVWGLTVPVLLEAEDARRAPMRYLCAVEAAFRTALDADVGYAGLLTKNPAHPLWRTLRGPTLSYSLGELSEYVDLPKFVPKRKPEEVGLGRNVALFDWLRHYAYRNVRRYDSFTAWQSQLNSKALERNGDFNHPMDGREVWHIAKSVAKWVWNRFDLDASDAKFSLLQAHRGRKGGVASGQARQLSSEGDRAIARIMAAQGSTVREIGTALGVGKSTVARWIRD